MNRCAPWSVVIFALAVGWLQPSCDSPFLGTAADVDPHSDLPDTLSNCMELNNFFESSAIGRIVTGDLDGDNDDELVVHYPAFETLRVGRTGGVWGSLDYACKWNQLDVGWRTIRFAKTTTSTANAADRFDIADLNGDGKDELVVVDSIGGTLRVGLNLNKDCRTCPESAPVALACLKGATGATAYGVAFADLNGDGKHDLICHRSDSIVVHISRATTANEPPTFAAAVVSKGDLPDYQAAVRFGDVDGDGDLDVALHGDDATPRLVAAYGDKTGRFSAPVQVARLPKPADAMELADTDGDDKAEIWLAGVSLLDTVYYLGSGGTFTALPVSPDLLVPQDPTLAHGPFVITPMDLPGGGVAMAMVGRDSKLGYNRPSYIRLVGKSGDQTRTISSTVMSVSGARVVGLLAGQWLPKTSQQLMVITRQSLSASGRLGPVLVYLHQANPSGTSKAGSP